LPLSALRRAIAVRRPAAGLVHHTNRGSQCCSLDYQAELRRHGVLISMSGKGNCFDNAMVETFFKTLKSEPASPSEPWQNASPCSACRQDEEDPKGLARAGSAAIRGCHA
jgi:transposase InsO family protein